MTDLDLSTIPAQPPLMTADGEPIPCPRCGRIYERPLAGIPGHPVGHPVICPPMAFARISDARDRKALRARL